jgi:hypothetical protein
MATRRANIRRSTQCRLQKAPNGAPDDVCHSFQLKADLLFDLLEAWSLWALGAFSSLYLGRVVMDRLEHSLEDIELPTCPNCGIEMHWYGSTLVRFIPATNLNLFNCPTCLLITESETVCEADPARVVPQPAARLVGVVA